MVSTSRDATLAEAVRQLASERLQAGKFPVEILFFEDVCQEIAKKPGLVAKHWAGWHPIDGTEGSDLRTSHSYRGLMLPVMFSAAIVIVGVLLAFQNHRSNLLTNSYCFLLPLQHRDGAVADLKLVCRGTRVLQSVSANVLEFGESDIKTDVDLSAGLYIDDIATKAHPHVFGDIVPSPTIFISAGTLTLSPAGKVEANVFFRSTNRGEWSEHIEMRRFSGRWHTRLYVTDRRTNSNRILHESIDPGFPRGDATTSVWSDASGTPVLGAFEERNEFHVEPSLSLRIEDGSIWHLDPATGLASTFYPRITESFVSPDCEGNGYFTDPLPLAHHAFKAGGRIRIRPDGAGVFAIKPRSRRSDSGCINENVEAARGIRQSDTVALERHEAPTITAVPPFQRAD